MSFLRSQKQAAVIFNLTTSAKETATPSVKTCWVQFFFFTLNYPTAAKVLDHTNMCFGFVTAHFDYTSDQIGKFSTYGQHV